MIDNFICKVLKLTDNSLFDYKYIDVSIILPTSVHMWVDALFITSHIAILPTIAFSLKTSSLMTFIKGH